MDRQIGGIHHVTAIARDPQANVDLGRPGRTMTFSLTEWNPDVTSELLDVLFEIATDPPRFTKEVAA